MTEREVIVAAAAAFKERDRIAGEMESADAQIMGLVKEYSLLMRMWGFTPMMLRRAVAVSLLL